MEINKYEEEKGKQKEIECNHCKTLFPLSDVKLKDDILPMKDKTAMEVKYFKCPLCGHVYVVSISDRRTKKIQEEQMAIQSMITKSAARGKIPHVNLGKRLDSVKHKFVEHQKRLKEKHTKDFVTFLNEEV